MSYASIYVVIDQTINDQHASVICIYFTDNLKYAVNCLVLMKIIFVKKD